VNEPSLLARHVLAMQEVKVHSLLYQLPDNRLVSVLRLQRS
jgi:hypothetical protein